MQEEAAAVATVDDAAPAAASGPPPNQSSAAERIQRIRTSLWVANPDANDVFAIMKRLLLAPNESRPECLAILGEPSFGKSRLLTQFTKLATANQDLYAQEDSVPALHIEMPESPEPSAMLRELLSKLMSDFSLREPPDSLMRRLEVLSASLHIRVFVIDELNKGVHGTHRKQRILLNTLRGITSRTGRPLIVAGTEDVDSFLRNDAQLDERFIKRHLRRWQDDSSTQSLLKGFERALALKNPSRLGSEAMTQHIIQLTRGRLGRIARLLTLCAEAAILDGTEVIDKGLLERYAAQLPGDNREPLG